MRIKLTFLLVTLLSAPILLGDVVTKLATSAVASLHTVRVDASVKTTAVVYADDVPDDVIAPLVFAMQWTFVWDPATPKIVKFDASMPLGNYRLIADGGKAAGITRQEFFNVVHHIQGSAKWHKKKRELRYDIVAEQSDDNRASVATESKGSTCEPDGPACSAFRAQTPALEGVSIKLIFDEGLDSFTGKITATQLSGYFFSKYESVMLFDVESELEGVEE